MATTGKIIEGLQILAVYTKNGLDGYDVYAEHDVIYAGPKDPNIVDQHDAKKLEQLGWYKSSEGERWAVPV